jgi:hypothetical protein
MKNDVTDLLTPKRAWHRLAFLLLGCALGAGFVALWLHSAAQPQSADPTAKSVGPSNEAAELRAEIEQLKGKVPDQSHAMKDVGYHFANLWFAGQKKNWPLAKFYLDETRSHLKWAVRIIPVRKTKTGDVDLRGILEGVDNTMLSELQKAIEKQDTKKFGDTYKQTIEGCYSCHKASEKSFLRPQIPEQPEARIMNFDPKAKWPE